MGDLMRRGLKVIKCSIPIMFAVAVAAVQAIGEQKEQQRIDNMEARIQELESKNEES